jgi:hypothetical protein
LADYLWVSLDELTVYLAGGNLGFYDHVSIHRGVLYVSHSPDTTTYSAFVSGFFPKVDSAEMTTVVHSLNEFLGPAWGKGCGNILKHG